MCLSALGQIIYGGLMLVCLALTLVSMFTPGWTKLENKVGDDVDKATEYGLFKFSCSTPDDGVTEATNCDKWFNNLPTWYKVVIASMVIAAILEIVALAWNLVTFCACCCKKHILHPLYGLALFASIFLAIAIGIFYVKNKDIIGDFQIHNVEFPDKDKESETAYSFYIACAALGAGILAFIAGTISACFADIHC